MRQCSVAIQPALVGQLPLEKSRVSSTYQERLERGLLHLCKFLEQSQLTVNVDDPVCVNNVLAIYVQHSHDCEDSLWVVKHALLCVQARFPHLRSHIGRPWACLKSWESEKPFRSRLPLPHDVMRKMCAVAIDMAGADPAQSLHWLGLAVLIRVGYYCLLRPAELVGLRRKDVLFSAGHCPILAIRNPKNRRFFGRAQFVLLQDVCTSDWLRWFVHSLPGECKLWPGSISSFRVWFRRLLQVCCLDTVAWNPSSLRCGGATYLHVHLNVSISRLKFIGRWSSDRTLSAYVQESAYCLVLTQLTDVLQQRINHALSSAFVVHILSTPPHQSWHALCLSQRAGAWRKQLSGEKLQRCSRKHRRS